MFATAELLEGVLCLLDFTNVLRCQQVNKAFYASISTSLEVQQKLHLKPLKAQAYSVITRLPKHITFAAAAPANSPSAYLIKGQAIELEAATTQGS